MVALFATHYALSSCGYAYCIANTHRVVVSVVCRFNINGVVLSASNIKRGDSSKSYRVFPS